MTPPKSEYGHLLMPAYAHPVPTQNSRPPSETSGVVGSALARATTDCVPVVALPMWRFPR